MFFLSDRFEVLGECYKRKCLFNTGIMIRKKKLDDAKVAITFILPETHAYGATSVVGDFNDWDPGVHRFEKQHNNTYSASVTLPADQTYRFRYLAEGGIWLNEDASDGYESNNYGSGNSIVKT